jgi:hypothetical protein
MTTIFARTISTKNPETVAQINLHRAEDAELLHVPIRVRGAKVQLIGAGHISVYANRAITKIGDAQESPIHKRLPNEFCQLGNEILETKLDSFLPKSGRLLQQEPSKTLIQHGRIPHHFESLFRFEYAESCLD